MTLATSLEKLIARFEQTNPSLELIERLHCFVHDAMLFELITEKDYQQLFMPIARLSCRAIDRLKKVEALEEIYDYEASTTDI